MATEYGSSPDEHPADHTLMRGTPGCGFCKRWQHLVPEVLEMVALAEKLRQVRGNGIDEDTDFVDPLAAVQQRAILAEGGQPQRSQALDEAGIGHVAFLAASTMPLRS